MSSKTHENSDEKTESAPKSQSKAIVVLLIFLAVAVLLFAVTAFTFLNDKRLVLNGQKFDVVTVDTPSAREKGLGGWDRIGEKQGMLFVYSDPGPYCMWMKDMKFNIDIVWFDSDKKIVDVKKDATPESYPDTFCPNSDAKYVLELKAGTAQAIGLQVGQQAKF